MGKLAGAGHPGYAVLLGIMTTLTIALLVAGKLLVGFGMGDVSLFIIIFFFSLCQRCG